MIGDWDSNFGEIQIWRGLYADLPAEDSHLLQNFASQAAKAFERAQSLEMEQKANGLPSIS